MSRWSGGTVGNLATYDPYCRKPEPTRLVLLHQIHAQDPGTKIRVLGCVHEYKIDSGTLVLKGEYGASTSYKSTVFAGIHNVLESVESDLLQVGAWVNIVGYVRAPTQITASSSRRRKSSKMISIPAVEVLMIWSAGAIELTGYQSAVRSFQATSLQAG